MSASKVSSSPGAADLSKKGSIGGKEDNSSSGGQAERSPSPEVAKCAICLGDVVNRSRSNACIHSFCFGCLLEWSKVKPECPLCKSSFTTIFHNFRSNTDYDEYVVPTPIPHFSIRFTASATAGNSWLSPLIRVLGARTHQPSPLGHAYEGVAIPAGMVGPPPPPPIMSANPFNNGASARPEYFGDVIHDHRRNQEEAVQMPGYQNRRRRYDRNEWVQPFGSTLQPGSVLFPSLDYIRTHPTALTRLRSWLYRELNVLLGLHRSREQMGFVYDLIIHLLNHYDIRSRDFRDMVNSYFGARTAHFQHELHHFILSGMSMEEFDRVAEYPSSSNGGRTRRNAPPEVITLDSDDDDSSNSHFVTHNSTRQSGNEDDIIVLSESSDDDEGTSVIRFPASTQVTLLQSNPASGSSAATSATTSAPSPSNSYNVRYSSQCYYRPPRIASVVEMPDPEPERPRRHTTNRTVRTHNVDADPDMPVLEPEVFPFLPGEESHAENIPTLSRDNQNNGMTIDHARATAALSAFSGPATASNFDQNISRPSLLSTGSASSIRSGDADVSGLFEASGIDLDLDVSVEAYSSPPRQDLRPLTSPDFPILRLRRGALQTRSQTEAWVRSRENAHSNSSSFASVYGNPALSGRSSTSGSAFVPYEPEVSNSRDQMRRPPRPTCILESSSLQTYRPGTSSSATSASGYRSSSPPFRVNLYPHGISSSQVMDLSRSAGLISSSSSRPPASSHSHELPQSSSTSEAVSLQRHLPSPPMTSFRNTLSAHSSNAHATSAINSFAASLAAAAGAHMPKPVDKKPTDTSNDHSDSEDDGLECLGSFPIQKKPPLAVITISSDDEDDEGKVKAERNESENLNILESEDSFLMTWDPHTPPSIEAIELTGAESFLETTAGQSTSFSSSLFPGDASNGGSQLSNNSLMAQCNSATEELLTGLHYLSPPATSNTKTQKLSLFDSLSHRKKSKRLRISSSSEDSDAEVQVRKSRRTEGRSNTSTSSTSTPVQTPKKRKYVAASPPSPRMSPPHFTTSDSSSDSSDSDDEDYKVYSKSKKSRSSKKHSSSSKKKRKSKSKKSKKSKKTKSKDKYKESSSKSRSKSKTDKKCSSASEGGSSTTSKSNVQNMESSSATSSKKSAPSSSSSSSQPHSSRSTALASTSSSSLTASGYMNLPVCSEFDYQAATNLLDLSCASRTDTIEDQSPTQQLNDLEDTFSRLVETMNLRIPSASYVSNVSTLTSTVDTSAIFDSPARTVLSNTLWYDCPSSMTLERSSSSSGEWNPE